MRPLTISLPYYLYKKLTRQALQLRNLETLEKRLLS